ncbi:hypothetical protein [Rhodococcus koreensis]|uniref:hypothetical protein n=1 Tax=Rhodococcus koreensis TaxID=99653 RepID=UPI0036D9D83D
MNATTDGVVRAPSALRSPRLAALPIREVWGAWGVDDAVAHPSVEALARPDGRVCAQGVLAPVNRTVVMWVGPGPAGSRRSSAT